MTTPEQTAGSKSQTGARSGRARGWVPVIVWAIAVVLVLCGGLLYASNPNTDIGDVWGFRGFDGLLGLVYATVGFVIASRQSRHLVGWLLLLIGLFSSLVFVTTEYAIYALLAFPQSLPGGEVLAWFANWFWVPLTVSAAIYLPLLFPQGHLTSARWRPLAALAFLFMVAASISVALQPGALAQFPKVQNPFGWRGMSSAFGFIFIVGLFSLFGMAIIVALGLVSRLRRSQGDERQQLKWFVYAVAITALVIPLGAVTKIGQILSVLGLLGIPISVGIAILRYRLYDIDVIINRTLVYVPLTAIIAGIFAASITLSQKVFIALTGQSSDAATVLTTLVVVAAFEPLKKWLQDNVDKRFKPVPDPAQALEGYSRHLKAVVQVFDEQETARQFLEQITAAFYARGGAVFLDKDNSVPRVFEAGEWNGDAKLSANLDRDGEHFGSVRLSARRNGGEYSARDKETLEQNANLVAAALALAERTNGGKE